MASPTQAGPGQPHLPPAASATALICSRSVRHRPVVVTTSGCTRAFAASSRAALRGAHRPEPLHTSGERLGHPMLVTTANPKPPTSYGRESSAACLRAREFQVGRRLGLRATVYNLTKTHDANQVIDTGRMSCPRGLCTVLARLQLHARLSPRAFVCAGRRRLAGAQMVRPSSQRNSVPCTGTALQCRPVLGASHQQRVLGAACAQSSSPPLLVQLQ